jgi:hypothetical protein
MQRLKKTQGINLMGCDLFHMFRVTKGFKIFIPQHYLRLREGYPNTAHPFPFLFSQAATALNRSKRIMHHFVVAGGHLYSSESCRERLGEEIVMRVLMWETSTMR